MHRPTLCSLGAILGVGLLAPIASEAAATPASARVHTLLGAKQVKQAPLQLGVPDVLQSATMRTKAGTEVEVQVYPPGEWFWPEGEAAKLAVERTKSGAIEATGEVVMIVFDAGDGFDPGPIVQMFHAMGATVVTFENPIISSKLVDKSAEKATDIVHAMITWTAKQVAEDGRLNLYAAGPKASALALEVGAKRTANLWSVMVDGADAKRLAEVAPAFAKAAEGFEGLLVVGGDDAAAEALAPAKTNAHVELDGASLARFANAEELAQASEYQRTLALFLNSDVILPPEHCRVCGLTRTAKRTVLRLDH